MGVTGRGAIWEQSNRWQLKVLSSTLPVVRPRNSVTHWSGDLLRHSNITILCFLRVGGRVGGQAGFLRQAGGFALDSVVHILFWWPTLLCFGEFYLLSALSPYTAGGQKIIRFLKKTNFFFFGEADFILFVIESLHSCQMICTWLFVAKMSFFSLLVKWTTQ